MRRDSAVFNRVAKALEDATQLSAPQARGTIRIVLRKGGLEPSSVKPDEIQRVLNDLLPHELSVRGYEDTESICAKIVASLAEQP